MKARRTNRSARAPAPATSATSNADLLKRLRTAERRARELERRLELVMTASREGFYDWNIARNTIHYSEHVHNYLGLPPGLLKTTDDWVNRIHADDLARFREGYRAHFKGDTARFECDYRFQTVNGQWRWARTHGVAIRNRAGRAVRMVGSSVDITELKQRERELAEHRAILQTTLDNIDQGITLVDEHLRATVLNHRFLELLRYPADQFKPGFPMEQALRFNAARGEYGTDPTHIEARIRERLALARRGDPPAFERSHPDGTLVSIRRWPLPGGGFVATYTDITEQRRAQQQIEQALAVQTATAQTLRAVAQLRGDVQPVFDVIARNACELCGGLTAGVYRFDDGLLHLVAAHNFSAAGWQAARAMFPMRPDRTQLAGRAILTCAVQRLEDVRTDADYSMRMATAGGWLSLLAVPMLREGKPLGVITVTWRDPRAIPDHQIALLETFGNQAVIAIESARLFNEIQTALAEQTATADVLRVMSESPLDFTPVFETIMRHAVDLCGAQHGIVFRHDGALQHIVAQHNYPPEADRLARTMYPGPPRRDQASGRAILDRMVQRVENANTLPGGATRLARSGGWNRILSVPMVRHGHALGAISVSWEEPGTIPDGQVSLLETFAHEAALAVESVRLFREIEDKSRQLEVANRHKSEFLANMSHELRTPLNAIIGFTRIVMRRAQDQLDPKQYDNLGKILTSGQHLLSLINAILDLAKVEAGRIDVQAQDLPLASVLEQCLRTVEPLVRSDAVALIREFDDTLPQVFIDEQKLRQIVFNLLSNAAKFTERGSIRLRASAANGTFAVAVADTGAGIPAEKLEFIFEQFEQLDRSSTRANGGTGLGLTISRRLARLMGGDIQVASALGAGSTFTLTLPTHYTPAA